MTSDSGLFGCSLLVKLASNWQPIGNAHAIMYLNSSKKRDIDEEISSTDEATQHEDFASVPAGYDATNAKLGSAFTYII